MSQIDTVIIDFHGTMTDHNRRIVEAVKLAADYSGMPDHITEAILAGLSTERGDEEKFKDYARRVCDEAGMLDILEVDVLKPFLWMRNKLMDELYFPVEGIKETIQALKDAGIRVAFLTNGTIKVANAPLHIFPDAKSYSDIIYELLVQRWGVYSGIGEDQPLIVSTKDDMNFHETEGRKPLIKPEPKVLQAMGGILVACLGGNFSYDSTLMVGDYYLQDAVLARRTGTHCAFHLKGRLQLLDEYERMICDSTAPRMYPYIHLSEVPYIAITGGELTRELIPIHMEEGSDVLEGIVVNVYYRGMLLYAARSSFVQFGEVEFVPHISLEELKQEIELSREMKLK